MIASKIVRFVLRLFDKIICNVQQVFFVVLFPFFKRGLFKH